jgi:hypothetical protein
MMNKLRELLKCPLDWVEVTDHPFKGSILEADWEYAVGAMAADPDDIPFDEDWIDVDFDEDDIVHAVDVLKRIAAMQHGISIRRSVQIVSGIWTSRRPRNMANISLRGSTRP